MSVLGDEQLGYLLRFQHLEKTLGSLPGFGDGSVAALFGLDAGAYRTMRDRMSQAARDAATELLVDPGFAHQVDRLPFPANGVVLGLGDSITEDDASWLEILRHLLRLRRSGDNIAVVNGGVSGDTTAQAMARLADLMQARPSWIIALLGTNDARRHGGRHGMLLTSPEETRRNFATMRAYAARHGNPAWAWITPPPALEEQVAAHWFLGPLRLAWCEEDLIAVAEAVRQQPGVVLDLWPVFGSPPDAALLLADGLHPSLHGQQAIAAALVRCLAQTIFSDKDLA